MKVLLALVFACLLAGCAKSNAKPQPPAQSPDCRMYYLTSEGKVCFSEQAIWLKECVLELAKSRRTANEELWFNGFGANDVIFIPKDDTAEEIFQKCINIKPLSADKASNYKKWLKDRVLEIQSISAGTTRKQVGKILRQNGGLSTWKAAIYSHKDCDVLKVRIEFESASGETGHQESHRNENDKVISVSPPYLGFFNYG